MRRRHRHSRRRYWGSEGCLRHLSSLEYAEERVWRTVKKFIVLSFPLVLVPRSFFSQKMLHLRRNRELLAASLKRQLALLTGHAFEHGPNLPHGRAGGGGSVHRDQ